MYRVLHRTFCTFAEESTAAATTTTTTNIKSISQDLFKEKNLKTLVEKFKKASDIARFRKKTGIYEDTVRRLAGAKRFRWELPVQLSVKPDLVSYNTYIKALSEMGSYDSAVSVIDEMEKNGVNTDFITFNALLDGLYSNGSFEDGEKLWEKMGEKNVVPNIRTYNARLLGLAVAKRTGEAVEFYEEMEKKGVKPDIFSFNAMIKGFANEGNLDEAKKWFDKLGKSEYEPGKGTYSIILPLLCEKGDLKTAFEMVKNIFHKHCRVDVSLLQLVVDKMASESMVAEAKEIVEQGKKNTYCRYKLNLPEDE
ncbi:hypothetical protein TSUD_84830 [Trifolium subterraneum]|uniref:Pentacotripeptide-repeat region of PRORP domain-containing protein n=1 Tax=Trifolium subterraneum TaxID=3900 RepID=A0A2Z6M6A9_TRISU|nr:hypothetical protein TSUD_84830 [Trifolium subterraneum]